MGRSAWQTRRARGLLPFDESEVDVLAGPMFDPVITGGALACSARSYVARRRSRAATMRFLYGGELYRVRHGSYALGVDGAEPDRSLLFRRYIDQWWVPEYVVASYRHVIGDGYSVDGLRHGENWPLRIDADARFIARRAAQLAYTRGPDVERALRSLIALSESVPCVELRETLRTFVLEGDTLRVVGRALPSTG